MTSKLTAQEISRRWTADAKQFKKQIAELKNKLARQECKLTERNTFIEELQEERNDLRDNLATIEKEVEKSFSKGVDEITDFTNNLHYIDEDKIWKVTACRILNEVKREVLDLFKKKVTE